MAEKVAVFIDKQYVEKSVLNFKGGGVPICWRSFVDAIVRGRRLLRAYFYDAPLNPKRDPDAAKAQQRLHDSLRFMPYFDVRLGRLTYSDPPRQKGVDLLLAVDMLKLAMRDAYDTAVLVSGDDDFADIVREVQTHGKHVELVHFSNCGAKLKTTAYVRTRLISEQVEELRYKPDK